MKLTIHNNSNLTDEQALLAVAKFVKREKPYPQMLMIDQNHAINYKLYRETDTFFVSGR